MIIKKRIQKVQAIIMALVMFFVTVASPLINVVEVQATENELKIQFHYTREDKNYDSWDMYTWDDDEVSTIGTFTVDDEGVANSEINVKSGSNRIGFIVRKGNWDAREDFGDRFVDVDGYISGTIHVYVTSGQEEVKIDYSNAVAKEYDNLMIKFHYTREDKIYDSWNVATWNGTEEGGSDFAVGNNGEAVAKVTVKSGSEKIGFIVRRSTSDNEWAEKDWDGDRYVNVEGYTSGIIHVYVTSGVEAVEIDYSNAKYNGLVINFYIDKTMTNDNWGLWLWDDIGTAAEYSLFGADENGKLKISYEVKDKATWVGFIVRDDNWNKDIDDDRRVDVSKYVSGEINVSIESGNEDFNIDYDKAIKGEKITATYYEGAIVVKLFKTDEELLENPKEVFTIISDENSIEIKDVETKKENVYILKFEDSLDNSKLYSIKYGEKTYEVSKSDLYKKQSFIEDYTYDGDDLGSTWTKEKTTFKVWAPLASEVKVNLYDNGKAGEGKKIKEVEMVQEDKGVWVAEVEGDLNGTYYTYSVNNLGKISEACDPYARTTGVNGDRAMIIDLDSTDPEGWGDYENPNSDLKFNDAIIYELHVRDASIDESSGVSDENKGKYLGLTEEGENTIFSHMLDLGITHLHLLPVYDYSSVDEEVGGFNWGYDPKNYNVPEGSYSSDPYNGEVRVKEMKQMIQTLHNNGISTIMDVVYNHVSDAGSFCFNQIVPNYFSRMNEDGTYSSDSGCGNDTASEHTMVRKYIVDSVKYWANEYHFNGFRFDLVGLIDTVTINEIMETVHKDYPDVVFYGEGWSMNTYDTGVSMTTQSNVDKVPGFAFFNDTFRDNIKGSGSSNSTGYVSGATGLENKTQWSFKGLVGGWCKTPLQTINYNSCHDNYTLYDRIKISRSDASDEDIQRMNKLAGAITIISQGIPFIHAGEEFLRSKPKEDGSGFEENSYNSSDAVNSIKWDRLKEYQDISDYYKGLIAFRKAHNALHMTTADEVNTNIEVIQGLDANVTAFKVNGGDYNDDDLFVIFNPNSNGTYVTLPEGKWNICITNEKAGTEIMDTVSDRVFVGAISPMILVKASETTTEATTSTEEETTTETATTEQATTEETTTEQATTETTTETTTEVTTSTEEETTTEQATTETATTETTEEATTEQATTEITTTETTTETATTEITTETATTEETTTEQATTEETTTETATTETTTETATTEVTTEETTTTEATTEETTTETTTETATTEITTETATTEETTTEQATTEQATTEETTTETATTETATTEETATEVTTEQATTEETTTETATTETSTENKPEEVDKLQLQLAINKAKEYEEKEDIYTEETYKVYKQAYSEAKKVNENEKATQEEVDKAISDLSSAIDGLEEKLEDSETTTEITTSTEEATTEVTTEATTTETATTETTTTETTTEEATTSTENKPEEVDKLQLQLAINEAKKYENQSNKYTDNSYSNFEEALNKAKEINENEKATQEEVDKAISDLSSAIDGLEEKLEDSETTTEQATTEITTETATTEETTTEQATTEQATTEETTAETATTETSTENKPEEVDKLQLQLAINKAKEYEEKEDIYTEETYKVYKQAYSEAKEVNENEKATQEEVDKAISDLNSAIDGLEERIEDSEEIGTTIGTEEEVTTSTEEEATTEQATIEEATTEETTSTEEATTTEVTTSTEEEVTTSTEEEATTEQATIEEATTEETTSTEEATTTEVEIATTEQATIEEATTEETTSTEEVVTTEVTTSTEEEATTEVTTSTEEEATTEQATTTEVEIATTEQATTEVTTSTEEDETTETTTSTEEEVTTETATTEVTTSTEEEATTEVTTSTEEATTTTEVTTSTEEEATTEVTTSTEEEITTEVTTSTENKPEEVDKLQLQLAINKAKAYEAKEDIYTEETYKKFIKVLNKAKEVNENMEVTQEEVNYIINELNKAIVNLEDKIIIEITNITTEEIIEITTATEEISTETTTSTEEEVTTEATTTEVINTEEIEKTNSKKEEAIVNPEIKKDELGNQLAYDKEGNKITNSFVKVSEEKNEKVYYFDESGNMKKDGLLIVEKSEKEKELYYFDETGEMITKEKVTVGDKSYYFNKNGQAVTDKVKKIDDKKYYFDETGEMVTKSLITNKKGNTYYFDKNGQAVTDKVKKIDDKKYYFDETGKMVTKSLVTNKKGNTYYFDKDGQAITNTLKKINGVIRYFDETGKMVKSKVITIDGKKYKFDAKGVGTRIK